MRLVWSKRLLLLCAAPLAAQPMELSLKRAVQLAVSPEGNTRVKLAGEARDAGGSADSLQAARRCCPTCPPPTTCRT